MYFCYFKEYKKPFSCRYYLKTIYLNDQITPYAYA